MLNNREWAILFWLGVFVLWVMLRKDVRSSLGQLLRTGFSPKILAPLIGILGYVAVEVWLGLKASLWRADLAKDTIIWLVVSGFALFFNYDDASKQPHFFRRRLAAAFGITEFLAFFTNLFVLNLVAEFLLQSFLVILALISAYAGSDIRYRSVKKLADGLLALISLSLLAFTASAIRKLGRDRQAWRASPTRCTYLADNRPASVRISPESLCQL
jgi:hypothetical protein